MAKNFNCSRRKSLQLGPYNLEKTTCYFLPFPKRPNLASSKVKDFADENIEFDENGRKFVKRVENIVGKRRNCSLRAISPFRAMFSKDLYGRQVKARAFFGKS